MDLDGDGNGDILSGSYSRMTQDMAGLFQVLKGKGDGEFEAAAEVVGTDGEPLIVALDESGEAAQYDGMTEKICTRPFAVDWDDDGKLDLVVGNFGGTFHWFQGEGGGKFAPKSKPILLGDSPIRIDGHHADPVCVDWDGDGDIDLLSGSTNGGAQWAENTAGPKKPPVLSKFVSLIEPGEQDAQGEMITEAELTGPTRSTRIWVDDVNGDGKLDILMGDSTTLVSPAEGLTEKEARAKEKEWSKKMDEIQEKLQSIPYEEEAESEEETDADEEAEEEIELSDESQEIYDELSDHYESRSEFLTEDRTGFVWLYLQK